MSNIDEMAKKFESMAELKEYADAQYNVILKLQKDNHDLKAKVKELEAKVLVDPSQLKPDSKDAQLICELEIAKLRNKSTFQELTLEDTRKLEIYSKVLAQVSRKKEEENFSEFSESELIEIAKIQ